MLNLVIVAHVAMLTTRDRSFKHVFGILRTKGMSVIGPHLFVLTFLLGVVAPAASATLPFLLDGTSAGKDVMLNVPAGGRAIVTLIRTTTQGAPEAVDLHLSQFAGEQGNPIIVKLMAPAESEQTKPGDMHHVKVTSAALPLQLDVGDLPTAGKYTGTLTMLADGFDPLSWKIVFMGTGVFRPATLVVDRGTLTASVTTCPWFPCLASKPQETSVHISDKNRQWPLESVTLRQEANAKTSEFDADRNLAFTFNGNLMSHFGNLDSSPRVVPRGQPATVGLTPRALRPGEYNATLRFQAVNSVDDEGQKVLLTVFVRHCMFWAVIVLLIALGVSFIITKILVMLRQRFTFLVRVRDLRPGWLTKMTPVLPVIWVRAMLRQSEDLSRRYWLTGQSLTDTRLNQVSGVLSVLEKVQQFRRDFDQSPLLESFVKERAITALNHIVSRMEASAMPDQTVAQFKTDLEGLSAWLRETTQYYWDDIVKTAQELLEAVDPLAAPAGQDALRQLKTTVETAIQTQPSDLSGMKKVEEDYARLKILWERRDADEFAELLNLQQHQRPLSELFAAADRAVWGRLNADTTREIILPQDTGAEPLESYEPLLFTLHTPTDPALGKTYLFLHGLTYTWTFELTEQPSKRAKLGCAPRPPVRFSAVTTEPGVVVYAPRHGILRAKASATYNGNTVTVDKCEPVTIVKSRDFTVGQSFERAEMLSFVIAGIIALVSGLSLLYAKNLAFGTMSDYLGLFLWGIGVDQGKNLMQSLQMTATPVKTT